MNSSKNKLMYVAGALCGIIILLEIVLLVVVRGGFSAKKGELQQIHQRLLQLHNRIPYPSSENIKILEDKLDSVEFHCGEMFADLQRDPFPEEAAEAADFSSRTQNVIEHFRKQALEAGVALPKSLEVGFSQYASGGSVPESEFVPRLSRQLYSVERIVDVLVKSGIASLDKLTRDFFELRFESSQSVTERRRGSRGGLAPKKIRNLNDLKASAVHPETWYYIERVGVTFSARENAVWEILSHIASAPRVMVVSEFSHSTKSNILKYNPEEIKQGGESDDETLRYLAEGILVGENALSRFERIISGDELVQVSLLIDVYNFDPEVISK